MSKTISTEEIQKISTHDFYFETSLYKPIKIEELEEDILNWEVDWYNSISSFETTYSIKSQWSVEIDIENNKVKENRSWWRQSDFSGFINIELHCKRKNNDILYFYLLIWEGLIIKIGQFPSLADIQFAELGRKYDKILPKDDLQDFKKAIWLVSHGAWAWSFVYLRRIFERLIFDTYKTNKGSLWIEEKEFISKRMDEKVDLLKKFLPHQLIEMKGIYWILSKWVHELSEDSCKKYFSPIKVSIELILDQKIEIQTKKEKDEKVKKEIEKIKKEVR